MQLVNNPKYQTSSSDVNGFSTALGRRVSLIRNPELNSDVEGKGNSLI